VEFFKFAFLGYPSIFAYCSARFEISKVVMPWRLPKSSSMKQAFTFLFALMALVKEHMKNHFYMNLLMHFDPL